jgi:small-conductance mechanosensitive channel
MPAADLATTFWERNNDLVTAVSAILLAIAVVAVLRRAFASRGRKLAEAVTRGELSPEVDTRLRLVQRLVYVIVIVIGISIALSQFEGVKSIGEKLLASGAIAAAVVGFAARQTLANVVAGVMLAVTQPVRVGDWILFDDEYGAIEDITLTFTFLRTNSERRVIIPNEKMASSVLRNDTLRVAVVGVEASVWLPPEADAQRALDLLGEGASVAESSFEGTRVLVSGEKVPPPEKAREEALLRARALATLRDAGLLRQAGDGGSIPN